jgi:RNA polymerase sigma-70 factor (ECF subfamily)
MYMAAPSVERELVSAARDGDRAALGQLLLSHSESLTRYLSAKMPASLRRHVSADDILQQAYSVAFRDINQFELRGDGSFYAWLKTIAEHQLQNTIKSAGRQKRGGNVRQVEAVQINDGSMRDLLDQIDAGEGTPSLAVRKEEAFAVLNVALAELPTDYREVIRMRFFSGLSLDETAKAMGRTPAAVRALTDRAKKQLQGAMGRLSRYLSTG